MKNFRAKYEKLENEVLEALLKKVEKSTYQSEHISGKSFKLPETYEGCSEIAILHDRLVLLDFDGYHYTVQDSDIRALAFMVCEKK